MKKTLTILLTAICVAATAFAEVDWTTNPVVIDTGTEDSPFVINSGQTIPAKLIIGYESVGYVTIDNCAKVVVSKGEVSQSVYTVLGDGEGAFGFLRVVDGDVEVGYSLYVGNSGEGTLVVDKGTVKASRTMNVGNQESGIGHVRVTGPEANLSIPREVVYGKNGSCDVEISGGGWASGRGITIGEMQSGTGVVRIYEGSALRVSENYTLTIGKEGTGIVFLRGGDIMPAASSASLVVRATENAYGVLTGWGTVTLDAQKSSWLENNGLVIADGRAEDGTIADRMLSINKQHRSFTNSVENISTNGWYAINRGVLSLEHALFSLPSGADGSCTWGEEEEDEEIDLVNSARVSFKNITKTVDSFVGKLYAPDHGEVPAGLPAGKTVAGIWKFDINGLYDSADVEFRYDHMLAPKGVAMYQHDGEAWVRLPSVTLDHHRVKVEKVDPTKMFAAVASTQGLLLLIR